MTDMDQERIYQNALLLIEGRLYAEAADELARIPGYKDADERRLACEQKKTAAHLDRIYEEALKAAGNLNVRSQEKAIRLFEKIPGYRDADEQVRQARRAIEEIVVRERTDRQEAIRMAEYEKNVTQKRKRRLKRGLLIGLASVLVCLLGVFLYRSVVAPALTYHTAARMIEAQEKDEAYRLLHGLGFLDSGDLVCEIVRDRLSRAEIGSTVQLGFYPQSAKASKEKEIIDWIVLDRDGSRLLLISRYALDCLPYESADELQTFASWETCLLRRWLNETFLNEAFDQGEARLLVGPDPDEAAQGRGFLGAAVDRVSLLSVSEADRYFPTNEERQCLPTRYAISRGAYQSSIGRTCFWWLRSTAEHMDQTLEGEPAENITRAVLVGSTGRIVEIGHYMSNRQYAVRPVIWVDTDPDAAVQLAEIR